MMRRLIRWGIVLALLWCGYWAAASFAISTGVTQGLAEAARKNGFVAPSVTTGGFPAAFEITLGSLDIADPATGIRVQSPGLQVQAAAWRPWHANILPSPDLILTLPDQALTLTAADLRGAVTVQPSRSLDLQAVTAKLVQPVIASSLGWGASADLTEVSLSASEGAPGSYDFSLVAQNLAPDAALAALLGNGIPISRIDLAGDAVFSAPLGPKADPATQRLLALNVGNLRLEWGQLRLDLSGGIIANADGLAEGRFDITVQNWRDLIPALVAAGALKPEVAPTITGLLAAIAAQGGDPDTLPLPLVFANGRGTLGPLPLGAAPRLN